MVGKIYRPVGNLASELKKLQSTNDHEVYTAKVITIAAFLYRPHITSS